MYRPFDRCNHSLNHGRLSDLWFLISPLAIRADLAHVDLGIRAVVRMIVRDTIRR